MGMDGNALRNDEFTVLMAEEDAGGVAAYICSILYARNLTNQCRLWSLAEYPSTPQLR
jgi:hypothetical protein